MKALGFQGWMRRVMPVVLTVLVAACGGGGGGGGGSTSVNSTATVSSIAVAGANALAVTVDAGPAGSGNNVNRLYTTVTVCPAGSTTQCQTIDHVLLDTGSTGLRLLASVLNSSAAYTPMLASGGMPLLNCAQFVDGSYAWGPVASADVTLGSKTASAVPVQIMGSPAILTSADSCNPGGGGELSTVSALGAKGILGLGLFQRDCGAGCVSNAGNGYYYTCTDANCTASVGATAPLTSQLTNPVVRFATDNNGFVITLPSVSSPGAASVNGALVFGVNTQSNNQFTAGSVLTTSSVGYITTHLGSQTLRSSFIDSGSNGLFFDSSTLVTCSVASGLDSFYCPASSQSYASVTLTGANAASANVSFVVGNAQTLLNTGYNALPTLAGPYSLFGYSGSFDWGLPFFYGRSVFFGIDQMSSSLGTGPLMAF
ncbi:DUF3443 domain-containing protein [Rhodoferax sp.]|uniref:DUF3443 domain-containing protein n=1 Tax=Rhodoferax sp. TaxID=50421 RepID=UPI00284F25FB|nr:DUF3443 domain-containing protein [Rhodoferax sp.]MDR3368271.1 DUF3443 domain-containing protein [Rhodoferax sp.]